MMTSMIVFIIKLLYEVGCVFHICIPVGLTCNLLYIVLCTRAPIHGQKQKIDTCPSPSVPGAEVERVDGRQLEGGRVRVEARDDGGQELRLPRLRELQHGRQDGLLPARAQHAAPAHAHLHCPHYTASRHADYSRTFGVGKRSRYRADFYNSFFLRNLHYPDF